MSTLIHVFQSHSLDEKSRDGCIRALLSDCTDPELFENQLQTGGAFKGSSDRTQPHPQLPFLSCRDWKLQASGDSSDRSVEFWVCYLAQFGCTDNSHSEIDLALESFDQIRSLETDTSMRVTDGRDLIVCINHWLVRDIVNIHCQGRVERSKFRELYLRKFLNFSQFYTD